MQSFLASLTHFTITHSAKWIIDRFGMIREQKAGLTPIEFVCFYNYNYTIDEFFLGRETYSELGKKIGLYEFQIIAILAAADGAKGSEFFRAPVRENILRAIGGEGMFHIIRQGRTISYLTFDRAGELIWTTERLDAIRYPSEEEAAEIKPDSSSIIVQVNRWDGHYEAYNNWEIQVFCDGFQWRYRYGRITDYGQRAFTYSSPEQKHDSPEDAILTAKKIIDNYRKGK